MVSTNKNGQVLEKLTIKTFDPNFYSYIKKNVKVKVLFYLEKQTGHASAYVKLRSPLDLWFGTSRSVVAKFFLC